MFNQLPDIQRIEEKDTKRKKEIGDEIDKLI